MKEKEIIEENGLYSLWYYPKYKLVHHIVHKPLVGEKLHELLLSGTECFEHYSCTKWLADDRGNVELTREDIEWGEKEWRPRVITAGWRYWAIVLTEQSIEKMPIEILISEYRDLGLTAKIFSDPEEAFHWLISV